MTGAEEAKELLGLVATPSALVTGTLLAFADRSIKENISKVNPVRMWFGLGASIGAVGIMAALALLMTPMSLRWLAGDTSGSKAVWVVFSMITLSVAGTMAYSCWIVLRCAGQLRRPSR